MKQDKIVIEKTFFVQVIVSLLSTYAFCSHIFNAIWKLPLMCVLVLCVTCYCNAVCIAYRVKSTRLKLQWFFRSSFNNKAQSKL